MHSKNKSTKRMPGPIAITAMMAISILTLLPSAAAESHCDATVSDGESIQAALDASSAGDTICVEPGTYVGHLEINTADLTLQSTDGAESTIIDPDGGIIGVRVMSGGLGDVTVDGFTVLENWVAAGIGQGLAARDGTSFHVINNVVMAPATTTQHGNAIQVTGDGSTVINNVVAIPHQVSADWSGSGILLFGASNVLIQGNTATSAPDDVCILLGGDAFGAPAAHNNTVVDNLAHGCGFGIVIEPGVFDTTITDNKFRDNGVGVYLFEGAPATTVIRHNHIAGNDIGLENADPIIPADARFNWWGCSEGPEDAACDPVVGLVLYEPWLTEPTYTGSTEFEHGEDVVLEATLVDSNDDGVSGIEVEFFVNNASVGSDVTDAFGVATLNIGSQDAGVYDVRAEALCGCLVAEAIVTVQEADVPPPDPEPECPPVGLQAMAHDDGRITVNVTTNATFDLVRTGGETVNLGTFEGDTHFEDSDTIVGATYTYTVWVDGLDCGSIEVTAIPVFPGFFAASLAVSLGLLAYAGVRRLR